MNSCSQHNVDDLQERLLTLEKQNHRLKRLGISALVIPGLLLVMGQALSKKTIEANEFVLEDSRGDVRARLSMNVPVGAAAGFPAVAQLVLFDEKGNKRVAVSGGTSTETLGFTQHDPRSGIPGFTVFDEQGRPRGYFTETDVSDIGAAIHLLDAGGKAPIIVQRGEVKADSLAATRVLVTDMDGFAATLGVSNLVTPKTGEMHKTSAASLILFGKGESVIWRAP